MLCAIYLTWIINLDHSNHCEPCTKRQGIAQTGDERACYKAVGRLTHSFSQELPRACLETRHREIETRLATVRLLSIYTRSSLISIFCSQFLICRIKEAMYQISSSIVALFLMRSWCVCVQLHQLTIRDNRITFCLTASSSLGVYF